MNKEEFLKVLEKSIAPLPLEEKESALEYYREYLEEIPKDCQTAEIEKLGNPKHIASRLIAEFGVSEFAQSKYKMADAKSETPKQNAGVYPQMQSANTNQDAKSKISVWTIIFAVLSAPITIPFAIALVMISLSFVLVIFSAVIAMFACVFAFGVSGVALIVAGACCLAVNVANGLVILGVGLLMSGLTILLGWGAVCATTALFRLFKMLISKLIQRRYNRNEGKQ